MGATKRIRRGGDARVWEKARDGRGRRAGVRRDGKSSERERDTERERRNEGDRNCDEGKGIGGSSRRENEKRDDEQLEGGPGPRQGRFPVLETEIERGRLEGVVWYE